MNVFDINKSFVSSYDEFLAEFDRAHPLSASQIKEIATFQRIFALRDGVDAQNNQDDIWKAF